MKHLFAFVIWLLLFFVTFCVINGIVVLIFPVSWNDCVTSAGWVAFYLLFGGIAHGVLTAEIVEDLERQ